MNDVKGRMPVRDLYTGRVERGIDILGYFEVTFEGRTAGREQWCI
jgi:hypothetical protein